MWFVHFSPSGRDNPKFRGEVDLAPFGKANLASPRRCQNRELQCPRGNRFDLAERGDESRNIFVWHHRMVAARLRPLWQQMRQVALPLCGVLARAQAARLRRIKNPLNAAAHSARCLGRL
jgi:hypothetical protein